MEPSQKVRTAGVLQAQAPIEVLRLLAGTVDSFKRGESQELARVTLYLSSASFSCFVSGIRDEGDVSYILLVEHDDAVRGTGINTVYIPLWAVVAVKVHEVDRLLHLFSGGKIEKATQSTPGILGLRNKIADEILRLRSVVQIDIKLEVSWETLSHDDLTLLSLYELIDISMSVVHEKVGDEFKRIAFKTLINSIRFQNATDPEVLFEDQILIIRAELKEREKGRFTRDEFADAIDTILDPS